MAKWQGGRTPAFREGHLCRTKAERLDAEKSQQLIATYESAIISLKDAGAMRSVVNLENEIRKEKRRMRALSREDHEVLLALAQRRDHEEAKERQRQQSIAAANARTLTAAKLRQEIKDNQEILKKRKREILDAECLLEMKHAMKTYSLVDLGDGRSCGGKASGKKNGTRFSTDYSAVAVDYRQRKKRFRLVEGRVGQKYARGVWR